MLSPMVYFVVASSSVNGISPMARSFDSPLSGTSSFKDAHDSSVISARVHLNNMHVQHATNCRIYSEDLMFATNLQCHNLKLVADLFIEFSYPGDISVCELIYQGCVGTICEKSYVLSVIC